jgi:hypothetical protein
MRIFKAISASIFFALAACGQAAAPGEAEAQQQTAQGAAASAADQAAILRMFSLSANASGQVMNECGELVTPQFLPAELGGTVGTATLFVMGGGPNTATCYGDGPDLHLIMRDGAGWREIYSARGRMLIVLPGSTRGVRDIADGGPGFSFPLWQWNGREYANTNREVSDAEIADATFMP